MTTQIKKYNNKTNTKNNNKANTKNNTKNKKTYSKTNNKNNKKSDDSIKIMYQPTQIGVEHILMSPLDILKKINTNDINGTNGIPLSVSQDFLDTYYLYDETGYIPYDSNFHEFELLPPIDTSSLCYTPPLHDTISPLPDTPTIMNFPSNEERHKSLSISDSPVIYKEQNNMSLAEQEYYKYIDSIIEHNNNKSTFGEFNKNTNNSNNSNSSNNSNKVSKDLPYVPKSTSTGSLLAASIKTLPKILPIESQSNIISSDANNNANNANNANNNKINQFGYSGDSINKRLIEQSESLEYFMKINNPEHISYDRFLKINKFISHKTYYKLIENVKAKFKENIKSIVDIIGKSNIKKKKMLSSKKGKQKFIEKCIKLDKEEFNKISEILKHNTLSIIENGRNEIKHDSEKMLNWFS